jgi:Protein of unknown function (DUF726)
MTDPTYSNANGISRTPEIMRHPDQRERLARLSPKTRDEILRRVSKHPLQHGKNDNCNSPFLESTSSSSTTTYDSSISSSQHTNSLLQAAAKSVLDNMPESCDQSDDGLDRSRVEEDFEYKYDTAQYICHNPISSPRLKSLQKRVKPAIPEEQDRKRFVGCLAAVLASRFSYDVYDDNNHILLRKETGLSEKSDYSDSWNGDDGFHATTPPYIYSAKGEIASDPDHYLQQPSCIQCGTEFLNESIRDSPLKSTQERMFRNRKVDGRSVARHRRRRYDVLTKLLLQSAEIMHLGKNQGRCFVPMLNPLLSRKRPREKGRLIRMPEISDDSCGLQFLEDRIDEIEHLRPFIESLSPGSGIQCLTMFLTQHLLRSEVGYDARVRHAIKTLGVILIMHDMIRDPDSYRNGAVLDSSVCSDPTRIKSQSRICVQAARFFENIEHTIAANLLQLSKAQTSQENRKVGNNTLSRHSRNFPSESMLRSLKIGGAAVAAGALFAVTGGLAAPGIAAGVAAIAGGTAVTAAAAAILTSTVAVTAIFGVGGGGLAAYKMQRRTIGLTEFEFVKESGSDTLNDNTPEPELFSTICLSGWLRDECDFQRPWGVTPSRPRIRDRLELLERFYAVHSPEHIPKSAKILSSWKGQETQLWNILQHKYGRDPSHLFPLENSSRRNNSLSHEQREMVSRMFTELGYICSSSAEVPGSRGCKRYPNEKRMEITKAHDGEIGMRDDTVGNEVSGSFSRHSDDILLSISSDSESTSDKDSAAVLPRHISTVWDYQSIYSGELYTVRWETEILTDLCDSVADLAFDVLSGGTRELLKLTALSTLMTAIAVPYALVNAANIIDSTWTLGVERADAAGKELARSLLFSTAGNRPITLVGFSFGSRAIYSCLKELARFQDKWEDYRERCGGTIPIPSRRNRQGEINEDSDVFFQTMREPASIVEDAILMGLPNHYSATSWKACRQIVSGRLVHCYSQKDLILSLMFQLKKFGLKAGKCSGVRVLMDICNILVYSVSHPLSILCSMQCVAHVLSKLKVLKMWMLQI